MTLPALATVEELEILLGETIANVPQAEARLGNASVIVRAYAGATWVDTAGTALEDVPDGIAGVVTQMVERATRNPGGITQEAAGPFSRSFGADASQRLYLTAMDKLVIRNAMGRTGIGTLSTSRENLETPAVLCSTEDETWGDDW